MKGFCAFLDRRRCKEQTPGDSERQRSLIHCNPWGWQRVGHNLLTEQKQGLGSCNQFLKNIYLKTCSTSFPGAQSASFSTPAPLQGVSKVNSCSSTGFSLCRGRMQMPLASTNLKLTYPTVEAMI